MSPEEILRRKLDRARAEIAQLEGMIETKTRELYLAQAEVRENAEFLKRVFDEIPNGVFVVSATGHIERPNPALCQLLGETEEELTGRAWTEVLDLEYIEGHPHPSAVGLLHANQSDARLRRRDGGEVHVLYSGAPLTSRTGSQPYISVVVDLTEKRHLEIELRHAQKLESVGQLAAGIAHEINTPIQYVGDSISFLQDAIEDLSTLRGEYEALRKDVGSDARLKANLEEIDRVEDEIDLEFLNEEMPQAIQRSRDGVQRVAKIVGALKEFAHPGAIEMAPADINAAIERTLIVARSEYRYVAEVQTELAPNLPRPHCNIGDIGQVLLNLIINAAHAIEDRHGGKQLGTITLRTKIDSGAVLIEIADTGKGISSEHRSRIFDPFYTTKAVGKGTGQGLSIARNIVVDKHGGELWFESTPDVGTTFFLRLPVARKELRRVA